MKKGFTVFALLVIFTLLFSACSGSGGAKRTATFTDVKNEIQARSSATDEFTAASVGQQLHVGGEVRSGDASKARLDIQPDNTSVYIGPNTLFTLVELKTTDDGLFSQLRLDLGRLWIVLNGGELDVETSSGTAAVRGSYMGVHTSEDGNTTVACLEGDCSYTNGGGTVMLTSGQACDIVDENQTCQIRDMTEEEIQEWLDNVPGASDVIPETPTSTPTPQPTQEPVTYGPDPGDFPPGINPLTCLPVDDPSLLNLPAVLISVTNFPANARPQAGLSFSPMIFEIYISEGTTRFLVAFYGVMPTRDVPIVGNCEVRQEPFVAWETVLGNLVWFDRNGNGDQDQGEPVIGGVCVTLYDTTGNILQTTSTDSNGYYGFNVDAGQTYVIGFDKPTDMDFTAQNVGYDDVDSDADPLTGQTAQITVTTTNMNWDVGFIQVGPTPTPTETGSTDGTGSTSGSDGGGQLPPADVGPVRSGRLPYKYITDFFPRSCLVYASASAEVLAQLPQCHFQFGSDANDINSAMLDADKMRQLAEGNADPNNLPNYTGNTCSNQPSLGGLPATEIHVYWSLMNQTLWKYDPLSGAYMRSSNLPDTPDAFYSDTDRLNGRQLLFDNVIVILADHTALHPTVIDINVKPGNRGPAYLFRDGQVFNIFWSTVGGEYEQTTGLMRPMRFEDADGNPVALKPGNSWVHVASSASIVSEEEPGRWKVRFFAPPGSQ